MSIKRGFTLIELMVAVSIFATVAVIATGAVLTANNINQKVQAIKLAMDNLNFALDSMTIKLKHGAEYRCVDSAEAASWGSVPSAPTYLGLTKDCTASPGGVGIVFKDAEPVSSSNPAHNVYIYQVQNDPVSGKGKLWLSQGTDSSSMSSFVSLTMDEINIQSGKFYVAGSVDAPSFNLEPRVLISLYGTAVIGHQSSDFAIETAVSDRR